MKTSQVLERLHTKFQNRLTRYCVKLAKAKPGSTDVVNQGSKIRALRECVQDVNVAITKALQNEDKH